MEKIMKLAAEDLKTAFINMLIHLKEIKKLMEKEMKNIKKIAK